MRRASYRTCDRLLCKRTHISGCVTPRSARAQSLYALHAMTILSVPPELVVPHPSSGSALKSDKTIAMTSASIFLTPGNTSGCNGFERRNR